MYLAPATDQPDSISCVPTATGMACDQSTAGYRHPSVYALRKAVGDFSGGMSYLQMTEATLETAGIRSYAKYGVSTSDARAIVEAGHPTVWSIDTNVTAPYPEVRTGYFRGGHSIHAPAGAYRLWIPTGDRCSCEKHITDRHGEYRYEDPGTYSTGYRYISASLLHKAALARAGNGGVNLLVLPDVVGVRRKAKSTVTGSIRRYPRGSSAAIAALVPGRIYDIAEPVRGEQYRMGNGRYSSGWYRRSQGGYIRADKLGVVNV